MSPLAIEILLHYYARPTEHEIVRDNPPIWPILRKWMLEEALLLPHVGGDHGASYKIGPRAVVWIEHVKNLPLPEWRMP